MIVPSQDLKKKAKKKVEIKSYSVYMKAAALYSNVDTSALFGKIVLFLACHRAVRALQHRKNTQSYSKKNFEQHAIAFFPAFQLALLPPRSANLYLTETRRIYLAAEKRF